MLSNKEAILLIYMSVILYILVAVITYEVCVP